jgi:hypothetical protein
MRLSAVTRLLSRYRLPALVIVLVAVIAGLGVGMLLGDRSSTALTLGEEPTPSATADATHPPSSPAPTPFEPADPTPTGTSRPTTIATPSHIPASADLTRGQLAEVIVDELVARSAPGTGSDSEIHPGRVGQGTRLWLFDGPVTVSGYEWYHVVSERAPLLELDPTIGDGWVAAASRDGELWLQPVDPVCPGQASIDVLARLSSAERFLCFGDRSLELAGWISPVWGSGGCGGAEPGWLNCFLAQMLLVSVEPPLAALTEPGGAPGWDAGASRFAIFFSPSVTRPTTSTGQYVEAVGHFDDPAAWECGMPELDSWAIIPQPRMVYSCRGTFVVDSISIRD